jgi:cytochrome c biogenesis protein CcdA
MRKAMAPMLAMLKTLNPVHTFFFGMGTTAFDLPTSAFYFVAIASIIEAGTDPYEMIVLLLLYNLLYILPLVLILFIYLIAKNRSEPLMNRINMAISKWSGRLTMLFLFLIGVILVVLSVSFFLNWHLI